MFAQLFKQLKLENSSTIIRPENKYFSQLARGVDKLIRLVNIIFGTTSPLRLIASAWHCWLWTSYSWLLYNGLQIGYNNEFLLLLFADDILVIASALCSPVRSQFVHLAALNCFTVPNFRRGSHQSKSCCYFYLIIIFFSSCCSIVYQKKKKLSTLHGSKNTKWASNLPSGKILKSYQTIILLLINI